MQKWEKTDVIARDLVILHAPWPIAKVFSQFPDLCQ